MKPFLGIDLTTDKNNEQLNGSEFLVSTPSTALTEALLSSSQKAVNAVSRSKLPLPFRILEYFCGITALLLCGGILRADVSISVGYRNAPWVFWGAGIGAAIWLILWLWGILKSKRVLETDESKLTLSHLESVTAAINAELAVPADAEEVDVLSFFYKEKNGEITVCEKAMPMTQFFNPVFRIFSDSNNLYLADTAGKYAFPLSSITAIHTVKKHIRILEWNKEESFNKGIYKQYKLTTDNYGCIHCKKYHIVEIIRNSEKTGIYIPSYELPVFERLTGLKAQAE